MSFDFRKFAAEGATLRFEEARCDNEFQDDEEIHDIEMTDFSPPEKIVTSHHHHYQQQQRRIQGGGEDDRYDDDDDEFRNDEILDAEEEKDLDAEENFDDGGEYPMATTTTSRGANNKVVFAQKEGRERGEGGKEEELGFHPSSAAAVIPSPPSRHSIQSNMEKKFSSPKGNVSTTQDLQPLAIEEEEEEEEKVVDAQKESSSVKKKSSVSSSSSSQPPSWLKSKFQSSRIGKIVTNKRHQQHPGPSATTSPSTAGGANNKIEKENNDASVEQVVFETIMEERDEEEEERSKISEKGRDDDVQKLVHVDVEQQKILRGGAGKKLKGTEDSSAEATTTSQQDEEKEAKSTKQQHQIAVPKTTLSRAMFHIFKGNVGGGVFMLPMFYNSAGYLGGVVLSISISTIVLDCIAMLLRVKNKINRADVQTYPAVARFLFGNQLKIFVNAALCITQFGFCIMYLQYSAGLINKVFKFPHAYPFFVICSCAVVTPMTFMTNKLHILAFFSMIATVCVFFVLIVAFGLTMVKLGSDGVNDSIAPLMKPSAWILYIASNVTVLEGIGIILPVENSIREKDKAKYPGAVRKTMLSIIIGYLIFGLSGYIAYGTELENSIVHAMKKSLLTECVQLALALSLILSYPLQYVPGIQILDRAFRLHHHEGVRAKVLRISLNIIFALLAMSIGADTLGLFFAFIGSLAATALCMTLPAMFTLQIDRALQGELRIYSRPMYYLKMFQGKLTWERGKCYVYLSIGLMVMVVGTYTSIRDAIALMEGAGAHKASSGAMSTGIPTTLSDGSFGTLTPGPWTTSGPTTLPASSEGGGKLTGVPGGVYPPDVTKVASQGLAKALGLI